MKRVFILYLFIIPLTMTAQVQQTFLYEITLYEQYRHQQMWTEKEHNIQAAHVVYLQALTDSGELELAGISSQGLVAHKGLVILRVSSFEEAQQIVAQDPSVKEGMMHARIVPLNIYFKGK